MRSQPLTRLAMNSKPPECKGCPLETKGLGFVPPKLYKTPGVYVIASGPGEEETHSGYSFVGKVGQALNRNLTKANLPVHYKGHVVLCWVKRKPKQTEMKECHDRHWGKNIPDDAVVVSVGESSRKFFFGPRANQDTAGSIVEWSS